MLEQTTKEKLDSLAMRLILDRGIIEGKKYIKAFEIYDKAKEDYKKLKHKNLSESEYRITKLLEYLNNIYLQ